MATVTATGGSVPAVETGRAGAELERYKKGEKADWILTRLKGEYPKPTRGLEPVDVRHQHVEHDRVRLHVTRVESVQRFRPVGGELDLVPLERERAPQRLADGGFVVDDEDLRAHCLHCRG